MKGYTVSCGGVLSLCVCGGGGGGGNRRGRCVVHVYT